ncbi:MAG: hypothetical protein ACR2LF_01985 [Jatrophihabitantaceae bacterium]
MANSEKQLYTLAVKEAMRSISQQQSTLESVRGRAGILLSAAMISTSLFGAQAIASRLTGFWPVVASALFVAVGACATAVLWPRRSLLFASSLLDVVQVGGSGTNPRSSDDPYWVVRGFADEVRRHVLHTNRRLDRLFLLLSIGWVLFLAEILA